MLTILLLALFFVQVAVTTSELAEPNVSRLAVTCDLYDKLTFTTQVHYTALHALRSELYSAVSLSTCICVYVYEYVYAHTNAHAHTQTCTHTHTYTQAHMHTHTHTHTFTSYVNSTALHALCSGLYSAVSHSTCV